MSNVQNSKTNNGDVDESAMLMDDNTKVENDPPSTDANMNVVESKKRQRIDVSDSDTNDPINKLKPVGKRRRLRASRRYTKIDKPTELERENDDAVMSNNTSKDEDVVIVGSSTANLSMEGEETVTARTVEARIDSSKPEQAVPSTTLQVPQANNKKKEKSGNGSERAYLELSSQNTQERSSEMRSRPKNIGLPQSNKFLTSHKSQQKVDQRESLICQQEKTDVIDKNDGSRMDRSDSFQNNTSNRNIQGKEFLEQTLIESPSCSMPSAMPLLASSKTWFLFFLFLQLSCGPSHILSNVVGISNWSVTLYESTSQPIEEEELINQTKVNESILEQANMMKKKIDTIEKIERLQTDLNSEIEIMRKNEADLQNDYDKVRLALQERQQILEPIISELNLFHSSLLPLLNKDESSDDDGSILNSVRKLVRGDNDVNLFLDSSSLNLWNAPLVPGSCNSDDDEPLPSTDAFKDVPFLTHDILLSTEEKLHQMVLTMTNEMKLKAEEELQTWARENVAINVFPAQKEDILFEDEGATKISIDCQMPPGKKDVLTLADVQGNIQEKIEIVKADLTGRVDHASIFNGASVIHSGSRSTTASIKDNLPLLNRLMAQSNLRFYGYGAEIALVPTSPLNSLGQCWGFEESLEDSTVGSYGTLSVRLPRATHVSNIAIEHPPQEQTDQVKSAIRSFRIIGYEDQMAEGDSWSLGSFYYDIYGSKSMQEFNVSQFVDGMKVPPLHSITLAIDSIWGAHYACLYRFRVHGDEKST